jgi:hypothetical protein
MKKFLEKETSGECICTEMNTFESNPHTLADAKTQKEKNLQMFLRMP